MYYTYYGPADHNFTVIINYFMFITVWDLAYWGSHSEIVTVKLFRIKAHFLKTSYVDYFKSSNI